MGIFKNWGKGFKRFGKSIKSGFVGKKGVFGRKGPFGKIGNPFAGKGLFTDKGALFRKGGIGDRIVRPFEKVGEGVDKVAVAAGDTATGIGKAAVDTASGIGTAATDSLRPHQPHDLRRYGSGGSGTVTQSPPSKLIKKNIFSVV